MHCALIKSNCYMHELSLHVLSAQHCFLVGIALWLSHARLSLLQNTVLVWAWREHLFLWEDSSAVGHLWSFGGEFGSIVLPALHLCVISLRKSIFFSRWTFMKLWWWVWEYSFASLIPMSLRKSIFFSRWTFMKLWWWVWEYSFAFHVPVCNVFKKE